MFKDLDADLARQEADNQSAIRIAITALYPTTAYTVCSEIGRCQSSRLRYCLIKIQILAGQRSEASRSV